MGFMMPSPQVQEVNLPEVAKFDVAAAEEQSARKLDAFTQAKKRKGRRATILTSARGVPSTAGPLSISQTSASAGSAALLG